MRKTSYQCLINSRAKYDSMLAFLDIKQKENRWDEAYRLVDELERARISDKIDEIDSEKLGRMRFALTDLSNLNLILDHFQEDKSAVFKNKFQEMLKGSKNQLEEASTTSIPRNTQFELLMCARFREVGLNAHLGKVHPDIIVSVNERTYGFECKRVFNYNQGAVQKNVEKAISQLNDNFLDNDYSKRGLPLLCIDRYVTGGDKILSASDEHSARSELGDQIEEFINRHYKRWYGPKVRDGRIIGVLIFMNITAILEKEGIPVVCHQAGASNNGWAGLSKQMFDDFIVEIASLMGPMDYSKIR